MLKCIHDTVKQNILPNCTIYTDLPSEFQEATTLPIDIAITKQRPDVVIVNQTSKKVILFELSIPFELNVDATHDHKVDRYRQLVSDIEDHGYAEC